MKPEYVALINLQQQIFGVCPRCRDVFRLSDCRIYTTKKRGADWLTRLDTEKERLDTLEERIGEKEEQVRQRAREKGRKVATRLARKIDTIFTPRKLNPDDAKVIFHPVDYVVFKGLTSDCGVRQIVFLDRRGRSEQHRQLQRSIERTVDRGHYEWITLRVDNDGSIKEE